MVKTRKVRNRKTKVRKTKVRKSLKLKGGNKQELIDKLNEMLQGKHHEITADLFINEVINKMCPDISSPKRKKSTTSYFGPTGTPIDETATPTHGPDNTPYDTDIPKADRITYYNFKPIPYNTDNMNPDSLKFRPRNIYDPQ